MKARLVVLVFALVLVPAVVGGQTRTQRIGVLDVLSPAVNAVNLGAFRQGMQALGYVEGRDYVIEYRSADGSAARLPELASDLVRLKMDVIVTRGTVAVLAVKRATGTIPIVMASSGDPVGAGVVTSLARPGGNVTGLSALATDVQGKLLEVVKEVVPKASRIAFLFNMSNPVFHTQWPEAEGAARAMRLRSQLLDVRADRELDGVLDVAVRQRADAVVVGIDPVTLGHLDHLVGALAKRQLPAISRSREFVDAGGLMSYGIHYPDAYRRAATYVDKILKGARPADLPVEQATRLELIVNLRTARALKLTIPKSILARADQVLE